MIRSFVQSNEPIVLFGGGEAGEVAVKLALSTCSIVAAADGGAKTALKYGITPQAVIGDFDSIDEKTLSDLPPESLCRISEQDSTDFDKALRSIETPLVLAVGFTGARMDHTLATMNTLVARADKRVVVLSERDIVFVSPPQLSLDLPVGEVFSLFPMGPVRGHSSGLKWPIDGLDFAPDARIGTSNEVSGPVRIEFDAPNMLVVLPLNHLNQVVDQLMHCDARWPARVE